MEKSPIEEERIDSISNEKKVKRKQGRERKRMNLMLTENKIIMKINFVKLSDLKMHSRKKINNVADECIFAYLTIAKRDVTFIFYPHTFISSTFIVVVVCILCNLQSNGMRNKKIKNIPKWKTFKYTFSYFSPFYLNLQKYLECWMDAKRANTQINFSSSWW